MTKHNDVAYRAFCEQPSGCTWSGELRDTDGMAQGELIDHTEREHPGQPVRGEIDESVG